MKLLEIVTTKMPSRNQVIQLGWIIENEIVDFDKASELIVDAIFAADIEVVEALNFRFCIYLEKASHALIIRSIMPYSVDMAVKETKIEFTMNGWRLRGLLRRWLTMDNIYLKKMAAAVVIDLIDNDLVFLVRDILDVINKEESP